jgi:hypothetical protein
MPRIALEIAESESESHHSLSYPIPNSLAAAPAKAHTSSELVPYPPEIAFVRA